MYGSAVVQQLLEKPDLQLDELLDEDGVQMELKTSNQRLISLYKETLTSSIYFAFQNSLTKDQIFRDLINYVIKEPNIEEEFNQKKIYKYPFTAAEILAADNPSISNMFFRPKSKEQNKLEGEESEEVVVDDEDNEVNDDTYLDELFSFLEGDQPLNVTSAGYFSKVVNSLLGKKTVEMLIYIFERKPQLLEKMAKKLVCKSIAEVLVRVLVMDGSYISKPMYLTERTNLINLLLELLVKSDDIEELNNISTIVCDILSKQNTMNGAQEILSKVFDTQSILVLFECLDAKVSLQNYKLLTSIFHDNNQGSGNVSSATIIINNMIAYLILNTHRTNQPQEEDESTNNESTNTEDISENLKLTESSPLIKALITNFPKIAQYLKNVEDQNTIPSTYGAKIKPLGIARLKLIELISLSLKLNSEVVFDSIITSDVLSIILDLFKNYEWNNMLHCQVEKIIITILDSSNLPIKVYLFETVKLLDRIINLSSSSDFNFLSNQDRKIKKGYNGQVVRISNKINESADKYIVSQTEAKEEWQEFNKNYLTECNTRDRTPIGESKGPPDDEEKSENNEESQDITSFMQKLSKMFQNNAKFQEKMKKDQKAKEEDENEVEEDIHQQENEEDEDTRHHPHHEEKEEHDDSTEEGSESYKHTIHLHVEPNEYYKPYRQEEETSLESPAEQEYNIVNYWKPPSLYSAEDILAELGVE